MKKVLAILAVTAIAGTASAQLNPLPPSSTTDGVNVHAINYTDLTHQTEVGHWDVNPLVAYKFASDDNLNTPNMESPDNKLGLSWASGMNFMAASSLMKIQNEGGTIRTIFTGESAGWLNDFGYSYSGNPATVGQSFTVFSNIQALAPSPTIFFGDYFEVNFATKSLNNFDLWLNGVGAMGLNNPPTSDNGGVYTIFNPANSTPYIAPGNVLWATTPIMVDTWVQSLGAYVPIATYLVGVEDWRLDKGADGDSNDFVFALQFLDKNGRGITPVPEPSTYGLLGAIALLGLVARRRFVAKKK